MASILAKKSRLMLILTSGLVLLILYFQALQPLWRGHLEIDVWVWFQRAEYFFQHLSFANLQDNELLPATLLYTFLPRLFSFWLPLTYSNYFSATLIVNLIILFCLLAVVKKTAAPLQFWLFLPLVLITGPILLFRFDTLVALLVIVAVLLFQQRHFVLSACCLALATAMKLYPLIFLPYFLLIFYRQRRFSRLTLFLVCFFLSLLLPLAAFFLLGGDWQQILSALEFHGLKYVSIESIPGSLLTATSLIFNQNPPTLLGGYGVWGITTPLIETLGLTFFNYLWVLPVGLFYLYLIKARAFTNQLHYSILFFLVVLFLAFSKNLHPQYIFWFISLFPLLTIKPHRQQDYLLVYFLLLVIAWLNQLVYPLLYTNFIDSFYQQGQSLEIFYLQLLRNFSIIALVLFTAKRLDRF